MSIHALDLSTFQQTFEVSPADKLEYGDNIAWFVITISGVWYEYVDRVDSIAGVPIPVK